jgi:hypothetical protein
MADLGEVVFRQRVCRGCNAVFSICCPVIAASGIAVSSVGSLLCANNAGAPIVAINVVLKVDSTIAIVSGNTGNAVHKGA